MAGLEATIAGVIDTLQSVEMEAQDDKGHWYSIRIYPYRTMENKIDGAVLVYINIDEMKRGLETAQRARDYAESIIAALRFPILVLDRRLSIVSASAAFYDLFRVSHEDTVGNLIYRIGNGQWGIPQLRSQLEQTIHSGLAFEDYIVEHRFEHIGMRTVRISGSPIPSTQEMEGMVLMQIEEVTDHPQSSAVNGENHG